ncbi:MAG TPA: DNA mismatch repair protein MutS [Tepiditoga sp.]|nr:DNA mismatch repair protein MutS [Tepiditoga sp.]
MNYKEKITGYEFILSETQFITSQGKEFFLSENYSCEELNIQYENQEIFLNFVRKNPEKTDSLKNYLMYIKNIKNTTEKIYYSHMLDDTELFEIKEFCYYSGKIRELIYDEMKFISPHNLEDVYKLLDPDGNGINTFYIFDSYDQELSEIRKQIRKKPDDENLKLKETEKENEIREKITKKLKTEYLNIAESFSKISYIDVLQAKAFLALKYELTKPVFSQNSDIIDIKKFFNPEIKDNLEKSGKKYQKTDICIKKGVTLFTGANMTGKTVVLKTLYLIDKMIKKAFFVPAGKCIFPFFENSFLITGDEQNYLKGLSSFAAEMKEINEILKHKAEEKNLILLDEIGRTTNPTEGKAIVHAVASLLNESDSFSLITTHFDAENIKEFAKITVKGIKEDAENTENIENIIDYSIIKDNGLTDKKQAVKIMKIMNLDKNLIEYTVNYLKGGKNNYEQ